MKTHPVLGILGGIGSGKSEAARILERSGAVVLRADEIAHGLLDIPAIQKKLVRRFGSGILGPDGKINRKALGALAFKNRRELSALNRIVHPPLIQRLRKDILRLRRRQPVVLDAALLLEWRLDRACDVLLYINAPISLRRRRVARSHGWAATELARRERFQISLARKRNFSDFTVDNRGARAIFRSQVLAVYRRILEMFPAGLDRQHR